MIADAEADGRLQPGGLLLRRLLLVPGMGLALGSYYLGYKLICVIQISNPKKKWIFARGRC
jgi:cystathionine beta-synthase